MGREHPVLMAINILAKCIEVKWPTDNKAKQGHQPFNHKNNNTKRAFFLATPQGEMTASYKRSIKSHTLRIQGNSTCMHTCTHTQYSSTKAVKSNESLFL